MHASTHGRRGVVLWTLALAALVAGAVLVTVAVRAQTSPAPTRSAGAIDPPLSTPQSTPQSSGRSSGSSSTSSGSARPRSDKPSEAALGRSLPRSIEIPAIGVKSEVNPIGLADDGSIAVPQPGPELNEAAWFENSPTPGQPGPSVIEGHVDSESGPSVFYELGDIRPGQRILVTRDDGRRLTFVVDATRDYLKSEFPTRVVYGAKDLSRPTLRLITCSQFDEATKHHIGNAVVFAHLTKVSEPTRSP